MRVELLTDEEGIYGVGEISDNPDPIRIITRPDKVADNFDRCNGAVLQMLPKWKLFSQSAEATLMNNLTMVRTQAAKCNQGVNRKRYFALKGASHRIVNSLVNQALAVCNQDYLRTARRYPVKFRQQIYVACCLGGDRINQIANTFPAAAIFAYTTAIRLRVHNSNGEERRTTEALKAEVRDLVMKGARLGVIADTLKIPKALRHAAPAVAAK